MKPNYKAIQFIGSARGGIFNRNRLVLVGDAAGVDPLFGEGIGPALGYGKVAAQAIQAGFQRQMFTFQNYRRMVLNSEVGHYLLIRWAIAWWGYRLSKTDAFMHGIWTLGKPIAWWHQQKWDKDSSSSAIHSTR